MASLEGIVEFLSTRWLGNNWYPSLQDGKFRWEEGAWVMSGERGKCVCERFQLDLIRLALPAAALVVRRTVSFGEWCWVCVRWWCVSTSSSKSKSLFFQLILSYSRIQIPPLILERQSAVPL